MDRLPDEIILQILMKADCSIQQLIELECVCQRFYRIAQDAALWYRIFMTRYPIWGRNVDMVTTMRPGIDWKEFVLGVRKQNKCAHSLVFEFVPEETQATPPRAPRQRTVSRKRKLMDRDHTVSSWEHRLGEDWSAWLTSGFPAQKNLQRQISTFLSDLNPSFSTPIMPSITTTSMDTQDRQSHHPSVSSSTPNPSPMTPPADGSNSPSWIDHLTQTQQAHREGYEAYFSYLSQHEPSSDPVVLDGRVHYPPPYRIQDPLVVDVDRITQTGVVATGKHRKESPESSLRNNRQRHSEHKILFWEYPSWRLMREFDICFAPANLSCQITGIQTIRMPAESGVEKIRLFSLAIGQPLVPNHRDEGDADDRVDLWFALLIYRLFDDGTTQCLAHISLDGTLLGREVFFFSDRSWGQANDGDCPAIQHADAVKEWLSVLAPEHADYDPRYTIFMMVMGPTNPSVSGFCQLMCFDMRGHPNVVDPAIEAVVWDITGHKFHSALGRSHGSNDRDQEDHHGPPPQTIATMHFGWKASCMIHFRYPPQLNHLICTGSYAQDELSVYDWRFGVKIGVLPWKVVRERSEDGTSSLEQRDIMEQDVHVDQDSMIDEEPDMPFDGDMGDDDFDMEEMDDDDAHVVRPWGLESTMVLPSHWCYKSSTQTADDLARCGLRLIAVGDNRKDRLEIKVWDISYLLRVHWDPLADRDQVDEKLEEEGDWSRRFLWWHRGTPSLKWLALRTMHEDNQAFQFGVPTENGMWGDPLEKYKIQQPLPYSPAEGTQAMILVHAFDCNLIDESVIPVKYTAYNVLRTSLFLLTEEGRITVVDIETGQVIGTTDNVAASPHTIGPERRIRGIDVNVIGGSEIVVTSREGLLRGKMR